MPDPYGFNHLGDTVRCIDCPTGGPIWQWPESKRQRHARTHGAAARLGTTDVRRQRSLLAAPPTSNEEKEATMATKAPSKGEPAKQVAIDILRKADQPLHAKEVAKRVLASGRCAGLKGKTPEATISAMLAVGSKPGGPFTRVDKGTYTLADTGSATTKPAQRKPAAVKRPPARKQVAARKKPTTAKAPRTKRTR
jgi:HB1, ASXL, restriction endonuclease HTH domain